jgi:hypothetical protein
MSLMQPHVRLTEGRARGVIHQTAQAYSLAGDEFKQRERQPISISHALLRLPCISFTSHVLSDLQHLSGTVVIGRFFVR